MTIIGLIAAMSMESNALLRHIKQKQRVAVGLLSGFRFELAGQTCVLVSSGMGIRRAAQATRALIDKFDPRVLISFGIAGAVEPDLEIGDVVAAESFYQLNGEILTEPQALTSLSREAIEAISQTLGGRNARFFTGTAVTTNGSHLPNYMRGKLERSILEMETAGIAEAASEKQIPLISLRSISDGPRAPIPIDLGEIMDDDANLRVGKVLKAIIRNPKILIQSSQMMRNSRLAADNAGEAVIALLRTLKFGN